MEDWEPDQTATVEGRDAYLWIVPAKVQGNWALVRSGRQRRGEVADRAEADFQKLSGTATPRRQVVRPRPTPRLRGADVAFTFVDGNGTRRQFSGRATGDKMEGTTPTQGGAKVNWSAARGRAS